jgi:hypothetical protein
MSQQSIQSALESSLIEGGNFSDQLFQDVLIDFRKSLNESLHEDADDALICVVVDGGEVALMLVEWDGAELQNESALARIREMWKSNHRANMEKLIPVFVEHLAQGNLGVAGIKWIGESQK